MDSVIWSQLTPSQQQQALMRSELVTDTNLLAEVSNIITSVQQGGDQALKTLTQKFDSYTVSELRVDKDYISNAATRIPDELKSAIDVAFGNINKFHKAQDPQNVSIETQAGIHCELRTEPIQSVGLYIPGGTAPLISTTLMLAIPAMLAGCNRKVLVSPPPINDAILYIAQRCGIDEIYQVGGAQAIAALGYGTETIKAVDKIFGPGNRFVTQAKNLIASDNAIPTTIDMPAGPSEVLVIADKDANPYFVSADLLSQAEHGKDSQVILVTTCATFAEKVQQALAQQLTLLSRKQTAIASLNNSRIIVVDDLIQAAEVSNRYAPEHLIIQTNAPDDIVKMIRCAGSIFVGSYSPEAVGDYASGTNHVLPTYGYSKSVSSLSLADFQRRFTVQTLSKQGFLSLSDSVITLANAEHLDAHALAIEVRKQAILEESKNES